MSILIAIICVDDNNGTMFNHRRQSQDRVLRNYIMELAGNRALWMNDYTARQFLPEQQERISLSENPLQAASDGELCLVEGEALLPYEDQMEELILFRWNRVYPADTHLDIPLSEHGWVLVNTLDFPGYSHERITQEIYRK